MLAIVLTFGLCVRLENVRGRIKWNRVTKLNGFPYVLHIIKYKRGPKTDLSAGRLR